MIGLKKSAQICLICLAIPTQICAQSNWNGASIGGYLGSGFGQYSVNTSLGNVTSNSYFSSEADIQTIENQGSNNLHPLTAMVGIQGEQNWALKNLILGVVLDYGYFQQNSELNMPQANYSSDASNSYHFSVTAQTDWLLTLRGKLGLPLKTKYDFLTFATSGLALTQMTLSNQFQDQTPLAGFGQNTVKAQQIGWTVGGGIQNHLSKHLIAQIEYLYIQMPSLSTVGSIQNTAEGFGIPMNAFSNPFTSKVNLHSNLIKLGIQYQF